MFPYDLHLVTYPGNSEQAMICFHGYGANYEVAETLRSLNCIDATLVGFNLPDYDVFDRDLEPEDLTFGTPQELLPALYVLKRFVLDQDRDSIDLYGFSAGGAVLINLIGALNTSDIDLGIAVEEKKRLLDAIQNGTVILDAPLKSVEEIIALRGSSEDLATIAKNYRKNNLVPIESLHRLEGLKLKIFLYFEEGDEILSNRDDDLYIDRLKKANQRGTTRVIKANHGGHVWPHWSLWKAVKGVSAK